MKDRHKTSVPLIPATHSIPVFWILECCCCCRPVAQLLPQFPRGQRSLSQIPTWSTMIHHEVSGSHSKLKDDTLGQTIGSLDKCHGYSGNPMSSLQQSSLIWTLPTHFKSLYLHFGNWHALTILSLNLRQYPSSYITFVWFQCHKIMWSQTIPSWKDHESSAPGPSIQVVNHFSHL